MKEILKHILRSQFPKTRLRTPADDAMLLFGFDGTHTQSSDIIITYVVGVGRGRGWVGEGSGGEIVTRESLFKKCLL